MDAPVYIIAYHAIDDVQSPIAIPPAVFRAQLEAWKGLGHRFLSAEEALALVADPAAPWPDRPSIFLTFDDALESVYTRAFPVLQELGIPASVYLVSDYMGLMNNWGSQPAWVPKLKIMTWEQAEEMSRHGIDIGSHSKTHPALSGLALDALDTELQESKKAIEDRIGREVWSLAYPYGLSSPETSVEAVDVYRMALGMRMKRLDRTDDDLMMPRVDAHYLRQGWVYRSMARRGGRAWLWLRAAARSMRNPAGELTRVKKRGAKKRARR